MTLAADSNAADSNARHFCSSPGPDRGPEVLTEVPGTLAWPVLALGRLARRFEEPSSGLQSAIVPRVTPLAGAQ